MTRIRLALALVLSATAPAFADPLVVQEAGDKIQLAASAGATFVVASEGTSHQRIRIYDVATRGWKPATYAVPEDRTAHLLDGATYFGDAGNGKGAVYGLDGKALVIAPGTPFRSFARGVASSRTLTAVAGAREGTVYAFDAKQVRAIDLALQNEDGGVGTAAVVAFSPDGKRLAVGTTAHYAFEIDVAAWKVGRMIAHEQSSITALAYSRDGKTLVVGTEYGMVVFDDAGARKDGPKKAPENSVEAIAFSPDGAYVAVGGREAAVRLYATATWKQKALLDGHHLPVTALAWSADGKYLATGSGSELRVWAPLE